MEDDHTQDDEDQSEFLTIGRLVFKQFRSPNSLMKMQAATALENDLRIWLDGSGVNVPFEEFTDEPAKPNKTEGPTRGSRTQDPSSMPPRQGRESTGEGRQTAGKSLRHENTPKVIEVKSRTTLSPLGNSVAFRGVSASPRRDERVQGVILEEEEDDQEEEFEEAGLREESEEEGSKYEYAAASERKPSRTEKSELPTNPKSQALLHMISGGLSPSRGGGPNGPNPPRDAANRGVARGGVGHSDYVPPRFSMSLGRAGGGPGGSDPSEPSESGRKGNNYVPNLPRKNPEKRFATLEDLRIQLESPEMAIVDDYKSVIDPTLVSISLHEQLVAECTRLGKTDQETRMKMDVEFVHKGFKYTPLKDKDMTSESAVRNQGYAALQQMKNGVDNVSCVPTGWLLKSINIGMVYRDQAEAMKPEETELEESILLCMSTEEADEDIHSAQWYSTQAEMEVDNWFNHSVEQVESMEGELSPSEISGMMSLLNRERSKNLVIALSDAAKEHHRADTELFHLKQQKKEAKVLRLKQEKTRNLLKLVNQTYGTLGVLTTQLAQKTKIFLESYSKLITHMATGNVVHPKNKNLELGNPFTGQASLAALFWGMQSKYVGSTLVSLRADLKHLIMDVPEAAKASKDINSFISHFDTEVETWQFKPAKHLITVNSLIALFAITTNGHQDIRQEGMRQYEATLTAATALFPGDDVVSIEKVRQEIDKKIWPEVRATMLEKGELIQASRNTGLAAGKGGADAPQRPYSRGNVMSGGLSNKVQAHAALIAEMKWHPIINGLEATVEKNFPKGTITLRKANVYTKKVFPPKEGQPREVTVIRPYVAVPDNSHKCKVCESSTPHDPRCSNDICNRCKMFGHHATYCLQSF
jgi:hypothetical protein